jgi:hypothetical protein
MDGVIVGEKARSQLGKGFIWPQSGKSMSEAAADAKALLFNSPNSSAAEVPMAFGNLYARADALIPKEKGYVLRETKASTFPLKKDKVTADEPQGHHLEDVAIQAWVMDGWGQKITSVELNYLDSQWRYPGNNDYAGLFRQLDVSDDCRSRKVQVKEWLEAAQKALEGEMPIAAIGKQCSDPYDCPFLDHCRKMEPPGPEHPIHLLPDSAGKALAKKLREAKGYKSILDPKPEELVGAQATLYRRIQKAHQTGGLILELAAAAEIAAIKFPRYYFDFEGIDFPVPQWKGFRPYEHAPFQWSCHIERSPGVFEHAEFLDLTGSDPSLPCILRMREVIKSGDGGAIVVYHATYERSRLLDLAKRHAEHAALLDEYVARLVDLLPIVKNHFYHPQMQGSFSIKKVLPVVAPDLSYNALEDVQEGTAAQLAYLHATRDPATTAERKIEIANALRKYCRQDTWAMVEVTHFLAGSKRPRRPD